MNTTTYKLLIHIPNSNCVSIKVRLVRWNWKFFFHASISNKKTAMINFSVISDKKEKNCSKGHTII